MSTEERSAKLVARMAESRRKAWVSSGKVEEAFAAEEALSSCGERHPLLALPND